MAFQARRVSNHNTKASACNCSRYGYCLVGSVLETDSDDLSKGTRVFCFHPHASHCVVPESAVKKIPAVPWMHARSAQIREEPPGHSRHAIIRPSMSLPSRAYHFQRSCALWLSLWLRHSSFVSLSPPRFQPPSASGVVRTSAIWTPCSLPTWRQLAR